jgi:phosphatidylserine/phosphatidylglycerophosphate/cardiolipin synthase-like enzyme
MSIGHLKAAFEYTSDNKVQLIRGGRSYFDLLLQLINRANDCIHLQTYIFDDDETGNKVSEALKAAVKREMPGYGLNFSNPFFAANTFISVEDCITKWRLLMQHLLWWAGSMSVTGITTCPISLHGLILLCLSKEK